MRERLAARLRSGAGGERPVSPTSAARLWHGLLPTAELNPWHMEEYMRREGSLRHVQEVIAAAQAAAEADPANAQMYVTDDFCSGFVRRAQPDPTLTCAICMESLTAAYYSLGCSSTRS